MLSRFSLRDWEDETNPQILSLQNSKFAAFQPAFHEDQVKKEFCYERPKMQNFPVISLEEFQQRKILKKPQQNQKEETIEEIIQKQNQLKSQ